MYKENVSTLVVPSSNNLDLLRLIFAGMVAIAHFLILSGIPNGEYYAAFFDTNVAVKGFFIISGLLICGSYLRSSSLKSYFIKRAKRILPAYIFVIVFCSLFLSFISEDHFLAYFKDIDLYKYLGANLVFLNFLHPDLPGVFTSNPYSNAVNGSLWTLKIEVMFYLFIPLFIGFLMRLSKLWKKNLFLLILYCSTFLYYFLVAKLHRYYSADSLLVLNHQFPGQIQYFATGIFLHYNFSWIAKRINYFILPGLFVFLEKFLLDSTYLWPLGLAAIIFYIGFKMPILNNIIKKNDYSYGLYIVHYPIAQFLISQHFWGLPYAYAFILYIIIVSCCSYGSWHLIEKPFLRKRFLK